MLKTLQWQQPDKVLRERYYFSCEPLKPSFSPESYIHLLWNIVNAEWAHKLILKN